MRGGSPATNFLTQLSSKLPVFPWCFFVTWSCSQWPKFRPAACCSVGAPHACSPITAMSTAAASCLLADQSATRLCCCCAFCGLLWQRQRAHVFQLQSHDLLLCVCFASLAAAAAHVCCMLRSSMLLTAAQRRLMVTPISYLEGRTCSFPLTLLLLLLWLHNQSCSAPRDMSIETFTSVYLSRP